MKWTTVEDYEALSILAAQTLLEAVRRDRDVVLGLPTGKTPEEMYQRIVAECGPDRRCFQSVTTFNLDEYAGIPPYHPSSYSTYMREHLFSHVDLAPERVHLPDGTASVIRALHPEISFEEALALECMRYEDAISTAGSLQLTFLGLGRNGHIGFNEPGTPFQSRTRVVELSPSTRAANARYFSGGETPTHAITIGIGTILDSASIVLLASGEAKREAVERLRSGEVSPAFPASALHRHHDVMLIVDRAAGG